MALASCLCRHDITEIINRIREFGPSDALVWKAHVEKPTLRLIVSMAQLGDTWSRGLLGVSGTLGFLGLAFVTLGMNTAFCTGADVRRGLSPGFETRLWFSLAALFFVLAMGLAFDIAVTSNRCKELMVVLHAAGAKAGHEHHLKLSWLESRLSGLNNGQGLGFAMYGTVVDVATLRVMLIKLVSVWGAVYTTLSAMSEPDATSVDAS